MVHSPKLGVITKADTLEPSHYEYWTKILKNETHRLSHGYYVTCLSSSETYDSSQIRSREREFFRSNQSIWPVCPRERLGSEKLTDALSERLHKLIVSRQHLPEEESSNKIGCPRLECLSHPRKGRSKIT
jgi:hypothetical protein